MNRKCYENMLNDAAKIVDAFWDYEGGTRLLAVLHELTRELLDADCDTAAGLVIRKMYEMTEVECSASKESQSGPELELFVTMLEDCLEENNEK